MEQEKILRLLEFVKRQDGGLGIIYNKKTQVWYVGLEFGKEAEDSPMVGGAAYSVATLLEDALDEVWRQINGEKST